jgi:hypothetical protein
MRFAGRHRRWWVGAGSVATVAVLALMIAALAVPGDPRVPSGVHAEVTSELLELWREHRHDEALLRDRLGGIATIVTDQPELAGCDVPAPVAAAEAGDDQVDAVLAWVEALRELSLHNPVDVRLLDQAEMSAVAGGFLRNRWGEDRIEQDHRVLAALGAVAPDADLATLRVDAFADQVSGFFLAAENAVGVRTGDPEALTPLERVVLAHEFEHALTFQNLGRPGSQTADAARAASAVVEGSAVLAMRMYAQVALTAAEEADLRAELVERAHADPLADYSPYLRAELRFPYREGLRYVCDRWRDGGWEAVDAAYADPPRTTAGVLFPERHADEARQPEPLGDPGGGWTEVRTSDFGAAELMWLLAAPGGDPAAALDDPLERAGAWDGGELVLWTLGGRAAVGLALVDRDTGPSLCESVRSWYAAAYPDVRLDGDSQRTTFRHATQQAALTCDGDQVRLGMAPRLTVAEAIAG